MHRRDFLNLAAAGMTATAWFPGSRGVPVRTARVKAVLFDAFPVFDPRPIGALAESLLPGQGAALMSAWRTRQFEYQWLRALGGRHVDFLQATRDGLTFVINQLRLDVSPAQRDELMAAWSRLTVWPDAVEQLTALRAAGLRLAFLSNMTEAMLSSGLKAAAIDGLFEQVISTDRIRSFKPDPRAYQLGCDLLGLDRDEIVFAAFAGWDVAGAKWFGYPTFWVNRANGIGEELGVEADGVGPDLAALRRFVLG